MIQKNFTTKLVGGCASDGLFPKHGGYRRLRSFQSAQLVYDATLIFCDRFVSKYSRTHDQMVQAARSGVQNIAEGSLASATSKKTELKLTNVARASLEELLLDYQDFLRQHSLQQWVKDSPEALAVRGNYKDVQSDLSDESDRSDWSDRKGKAPDPYHIARATPDVAANTVICLINQATYLLRRQLLRLEQEFLEHGGFTERLFAARFQKRSVLSDRSDTSDKSDQSDISEKPLCPLCCKPMVQRTARKGQRAGKTFWGCTSYPSCKGTRPGNS